VTGKLVGKEATARLGCLARLAETPLDTLKPLSVLNPFIKATMPSLADHSRAAVPAVMVESEYKVFRPSLLEF
jgi:hypothetical protein